ncbi:hypothetical protein NKJ26_29295 [Mesorhizobium sp. M0152]|uniref:hypothetical protein n=1 Tax=Mesorhizobium sp. M0152 TaxID=2956898 RepID=UPI00333ACF6A
MVDELGRPAVMAIRLELQRATLLGQGQRDDWFASSFITTFAVLSGIAFLLLAFWEIGRGDPTVDIRLLFTRESGSCFLVMMAVGSVLFSTKQSCHSCNKRDAVGPLNNAGRQRHAAAM